MKTKRLCISIILLITTVVCFGAGTKESDKTTLSYLTWYTQGEETPILNQFMGENPAITVSIEAVDGTKYGEILKMRMSAGDLPDVITCKQNFVEMLMREGWAQDLSQEPAVKLLDRAPNVKNALTYGGKIYSIPHEAAVGYGHMYYNKVIFKKLGLPVPFNPKTLEEIEAALDTIAKAGIEPVLFGGKDFWVTGYFALRYFESNLYGSVIAKNNGVIIEPNEAFYRGVAKPSDGVRLAFETLKKWQTKGWISKNSLSMTWPESFTHFAAGNAAIFPQGPWVPGMEEAKNADSAIFELGCFYMPQKSVDGKHYATGYVDKMIMINAKSKHLAEAKTLLNWLGTEKNLVSYLNGRKIGQFILPLAGLESQPVFSDWSKTIDDLKPVTILTTFPFVPGDEHTNYGEFSQAILAGETVDKALADLDAFYTEHRGEIKVPAR